MKRLIFAGILSAFIIASLTFSILYVNAVCKETKKMLNECITAYDNNHKSYEKADKPFTKDFLMGPNSFRLLEELLRRIEDTPGVVKAEMVAG